MTLQAAGAPRRILFQNLMQTLGLCLLVAVSMTLLAWTTSDDSVANRDFISYWAAGQSLLHGSNPYDANPILRIERSAGWHGSGVMIMRNPPSALFLTLPLGLLHPKEGWFLWTLLVLLAWLGSIHVLWTLNGKPNQPLHFIGYLFAPAIACFLLGQCSLFALFGLALFFHFHRSRPVLAGAALVLCMFKPHLFLPFGVVLLAWMATRKSYRVFFSAAAALVVTCIAPLFFDPSVYAQYEAMARSSQVQNEFVPTWSELLRIALKPDAFWLQFLPAIAGCLWAIGYFRRHRTEWDWHTHSPLLMLVSVLVAPYAWFFDGAVLLPSLLYAAYRARRNALALLFGLLLLANIQLALGTPSHSAWYLWWSPAWLAWYLWSMHPSQNSAVRGNAASTPGSKDASAVTA